LHCEGKANVPVANLAPLHQSRAEPTVDELAGHADQDPGGGYHSERFGTKDSREKDSARELQRDPDDRGRV
jgi:hypothetical protein